MAKAWGPGTKRAAAGLLTAGLLLAQDAKAPATDLTLHINVNLIQVDAVVTDGKGRPVTNLARGDFEILEDGKPQAISNFEFVSPAQQPETTRQNEGAPVVPLLPEQVTRTIILVADDLGLSFESVAFVRRALNRFVDRDMQPGDLVAILRTSRVNGAVHGFTNDKTQLRAAIDAVRWNPDSRNGPSFYDATAYGPPGARDPLRRFVDERGEALEYEANQYRYISGTMTALRNMIRGLRDFPGRKGMIVFSDGVPIWIRGGEWDNIQRSLHEVADYANRSSVVLNTIDARGLPALEPGAEDRLSQDQSPQQVLDDRRHDYFESQVGLDYLASQTGGRFIHDNNDLGWGLDRVLEDLNQYYLIGFKPDCETFEKNGTVAKFHNLQVHVLRPGLHVRSRRGFYGVPDDDLAKPAATADEQLAQAVESPFGRSEIPLKISCVYESDLKQAHVVVMLHADASHIQFAALEGGNFLATFDVLVRGYDQDGRAANTAFTPGLTLNAAEKHRVESTGLNYMTRVGIPHPGGYQFSAALRDRASGRIGSASAFVLAPNLRNGRFTIGGLALGRVDASDGLDTPAAREFEMGKAVPYKFSLFNSKSNGAQPALMAQVKLFRNGKQVYAAPEQSVAGSLAKTLVVGGALDPRVLSGPGYYDLEIVATDRHGRKPSISHVWSDFTIRDAHVQPASGG